MVHSAGKTVVRFGLVLLLSTLVRPAAVQAGIDFQTGDFIGTVLDSHGMPVPGVEIYAEDSKGRFIARAVTDESGSYQIVSLLEGEYHLTLDPRATGYQGQTIVAEIAASGSLIVDWRLSFKYPARTVATPAIA